MRVLSKDNGFTFIEVMVALVVLGIGISALYAMQTTSIRGNAAAIALTELSTRTAGHLEHIVGASFDDEILMDRDLDGTGQDANQNGIDEDDEGLIGDGIMSFGLHDVRGAADYCEVIDGPAPTDCDDPDNRTTISWNVAVDVPAPNMKTVHVIVITKKFGKDKKVEFEYYKDDVI